MDSTPLIVLNCIILSSEKKRYFMLSVYIDWVIDFTSVCFVLFQKRSIDSNLLDAAAVYIRWSDVTVIYAHITISMLWGNTA